MDDPDRSDLTDLVAPSGSASASAWVAVPGSRAEARRARRLRRDRWQRMAALSVLVAATSAFVYVVWPGRMSNDTLLQIGEMRAGEYTDWHAPLLLALWRPFDRLGMSPGWVTWAAAVTFVVALYAVLRMALNRPLAVLATLAVVATPQVLGHLGYLGRDLWFTAFLLLALAGLLRTAQLRGRARVAAAVATFVALWLMVASRQNAIPVAGVLLLAGVASTGAWRRLGRFDRTSGARGKRLLARSVRVGIATALLVVLIGSQFVARKALGVHPSHPEQATYLYDLAALSVRENEVLFSPEIYPAQDLETLKAKFSPSVVNTLLFGQDPPIPFPIPQGTIDILRDDWVRAVTDHPRGYLADRWALWKTQVAWTGYTEWVYHPFVDANEWGYEIERPELDRYVQDYLRSSAANDYLYGGPLYEVWVYLALTVVGVGYLFDRRMSREVLGWACLASLAYAATIAVGAMGVGYRLLYPSVVVTLILVVVAAADAVRLLAGAVTRLRSRADTDADADAGAGRPGARSGGPAAELTVEELLDPVGVSATGGDGHELPTPGGRGQGGDPEQSVERLHGQLGRA